MKAEQCKFEKKEIKFLGMIIRYGKMCMDPEKIKAVAEWPEPKNKKQLQKFLGFANFYWQFIKSYSGVVKPLTKLTGNEEWKWGKEQKEAMKELKRRVCSEPVLTIPVDNAPFRGETDASDYALGAVLSQKIEEKWHPVAYMSKAMNDTQRNYEIYDKEMLGIMMALEEW